jgi:hypothetical protein
MSTHLHILAGLILRWVDYATPICVHISLGLVFELWFDPAATLGVLVDNPAGMSNCLLNILLLGCINVLVVAHLLLNLKCQW